MEIVNLSHNDTLAQVVRKCNTNFRQLAWSSRQALKKQAEISLDSITSVIAGMQNEIDAMRTTTIPDTVSAQITAADIPGQVATAVDAALGTEMTSTLADFFTEDGCTVTACQAIKWGNIAFIRFSYRLNSALTVPSNGDITDVTLGTLKIGWRPADMTNVILDQTRILIGDVDNSGAVKARSANSRGTSYTIDANAVLYASMTLMLGVQ